MSAAAVAGAAGDRRRDEDSHPIAVEELSHFARLERERVTLTGLRQARVAARMGLSAVDHKVFDLVELGEAPLTAGRIAELTGLTTGAVTGVIDRLERVGLVRRSRHPGDRRKVLVVPSDRAVSPAGELRELLTVFSPAEREVIRRYLDLVLEQLRAETTNALART